MPSRTAFSSTDTTFAGMAAGPEIIMRVYSSKSSTPASFMVGTSGRLVRRLSAVTASASSLPDLMLGKADVGKSKLLCTVPAIRSSSAGPLPL
ncbi:hypothetical protein D3C72_1718160 [compost metagenome]